MGNEGEKLAGVEMGDIMKSITEEHKNCNQSHTAFRDNQPQ